MKIFSTSVKKASSLLVLPVLAFMSPNSRAEGIDYRLTLGTSISTFDTSLQINADIGDDNGLIDLEDNLGYDSSANFVIAKFEIDFNNNHSLALTVLPFTRSSSFSLQESIEFEGDVILADADIRSDISTNAFDLEYAYQFATLGDSKFEIVAGIYWMKSKFDLKASGLIQTEDGNVNFEADYQNNRSVDIPLPLLGGRYQYAINNHWNLKATAKFFGYEFDSVDGSATSVVVSAEYESQDSWGLGASVSYFDLDVVTTDPDSRGQFIWQYNSLNAYAFWNF